MSGNLTAKGSIDDEEAFGYSLRKRPSIVGTLDEN